MKNKPDNIVFIFSDQHSREKLGCYGNEHIHTPNLDRLAENGVMFENGYCNNPICVPSRASMTTGDFTFKNSFWDNARPYDGKQIGWGHRLEENGYKVTTFGKLHYKNDSPETGFLDQRLALNIREGIGDITHNIRENYDRSWLKDVMLDAGEGDSDYLSFDEKVAEMAAKFIEEKGKEKDGEPWCLYAGLVCPHFPWKVPKEILDLYKPFDKLPFPKEWALNERPMHERIQYLRRETGIDDESITDDEVRRAVATYYGMCTYVDMQVGVILAALEKAGLSDTTKVIYSTDHGDCVGEHGLFFKHNMYEGSVGVPLIIGGAGVPSGETVSSPVSLVDIYPTLLDNFGIEQTKDEEELPGVSLLKYFNGEKVEERTVFAESHCVGAKEGIFMVRYKEYKLVYYVGSYPQLFNLQNDPSELNDLANNVDYSDILKVMEGKLREICDPEEVDNKAKTEQEEMLNEHGGLEVVLNQKLLKVSPVPKG